MDKITPSSAGKLHIKDARDKMKRVLPAVAQSAEKMLHTVGLFGARPCDADPRVSQHLAFIAPEFGLLRDACHGAFEMPPPAHHVRAWLALEEIGACIYTDESDRKRALLQWHAEWFPGIPVQPPNTHSSSSDSSKRHKGNDGQVVVEWAKLGPEDVAAMQMYYTMIAEFKSEVGSSGDPQFQLMRYHQAGYGNAGERWTALDELVRGTGVPAIGLAVVGPYIMFWGLSVLRTNVVGCEPLSPMLPLLACHSRDPRSAQRGATALAAYDVVMHRLLQRYMRAAPPGCTVTRAIASAVEIQVATEAHETRVEAALRSFVHPDVDYRAALSSVQLSHQQVKALAQHRGDAWCPYPYPLWLGTSQYSNVQLLQLQTMPDKTVFTAQHPDGQVFVKLTAGDYPAWIHAALHAAGVVPRLVECRVLPGGGCLVAMELLDPAEWLNLHVWFGELPMAQQQAAKEQVMPLLQRVLRTVHNVHIPMQPPVANTGASSSSTTSGWSASRLRNRVGGKVVLGDARKANCMIKLGRDAAGKRSMEVKLVDLDWAGVDGQTRYPMRHIGQPGCGINWHEDVQPGAVMRQEHDTHLLLHSDWE